MTIAKSAGFNSPGLAAGKFIDITGTKKYYISNPDPLAKQFYKQRGQNAPLKYSVGVFTTLNGEL